MASVDLNALTEVQTPASTDNLLLFNETSNVAARIDYDKLAEAILNKTRSEIGGVSPISAIAALNSRLSNGGINSEIEYYTNTDANTHLTAGIRYYGGGCSNIPDNYMYIITLSSNKSGDTIQIGFPVTDEKIYMRHGRRTEENFTAWKKIDLVSIS